MPCGEVRIVRTDDSLKLSQMQTESDERGAIEAAAKPITIVLADDHAMFRSGLRMILEHHDEFEVVEEAGDVETTLRKVLGYRPGLLVLDINMGEESSLDAIPRIREISPETAIVVLTMENEPVMAREAVRAGAAAYVIKESAHTELVAALRAAAAGETYVNPRLGAKIASLPEAPTGPPGGLTEREAEVLRMIALGHSNGEISEALTISVRTVESHRTHIQQKLLANTRAELVAFAREHGIA